jgi:uncharacterized protein YdiU (UPF0061 family)
MSIVGETIDYGPCAFMDAYDPGTVYSSIDEHGRYAFFNQPPIAQWNLARFAEALMPLLSEDQDSALQQARQEIDTFRPRFEAAYAAGLTRKLGLHEQKPGDLQLAEDLLDRMAQNEADFTLTFRRLSDAAEDRRNDGAVAALFAKTMSFEEWAEMWHERLSSESSGTTERGAAMRAINPLFIPRNHRVEQAIAAALNGDFVPFETLVTVLAKPFDDQPQFVQYAEPPRPEDVVRQTFCGT